MAALAAAACGPAEPAPAVPSGRAEPASSGGQRRIIVVGAGIAGLVVANDLVKKGFDVTVLEARTRPGGRIYTVRGFRDGLYGEAGATWVVSDPDLLAAVKDSGAELEPPRSKKGSAKLAYPTYFGGKRKVYPPGDEGPPDPGLALLSPEEKKVGLPSLLEKYFAAGDEIDAAKEEWLSGKFDKLDRMSLAEYVRSLGGSAGVAAFLYEMLPLGDSAETTSALSILREWAAIREEQKLPERASWIKGGTDNLPFGLAARLGDRVVYGAEVKRLEQDERGVRAVFVRKGETHRIEGARMVCAIPYSVLRGVEVSPAFSEAKRRVVSSLRMVNVSRAYIQTERRFWEERGESGAASTDLPVVGDITEESRGLPGTAGLLSIWALAARARKLAATSEKDLIEAVVAEMEKVHPGLRERFVSGVVQCWDNDPFSRGAYAWFEPGQMTGFGEAIRASEGRIHFAGDHTSYRPGFMHGAVASAKRAVREIEAAIARQPT
jgi:monoamine oxidase